MESKFIWDLALKQLYGTHCSSHVLGQTLRGPLAQEPVVRGSTALQLNLIVRSAPDINERSPRCRAGCRGWVTEKCPLARRQCRCYLPAAPSLTVLTSLWTVKILMTLGAGLRANCGHSQISGTHRAWLLLSLLLSWAVPFLLCRAVPRGRTAAIPCKPSH